MPIYFLFLTYYDSRIIFTMTVVVTMVVVISMYARTTTEQFGNRVSDYAGDQQ